MPRLIRFFTLLLAGALLLTACSSASKESDSNSTTTLASGAGTLSSEVRTCLEGFPDDDAGAADCIGGAAIKRTNTVADLEGVLEELEAVLESEGGIYCRFVFLEVGREALKKFGTSAAWDTRIPGCNFAYYSEITPYLLDYTDFDRVFRFFGGLCNEYRESGESGEEILCVRALGTGLVGSGLSDSEMFKFCATSSIVPDCVSGVVIGRWNSEGGRPYTEINELLEFCESLRVKGDDEQFNWRVCLLENLRLMTYRIPGGEDKVAEYCEDAGAITTACWIALGRGLGTPSKFASLDYDLAAVVDLINQYCTVSMCSLGFGQAATNTVGPEEALTLCDQLLVGADACREGIQWRNEAEVK